jgi:hypothetical protein
MHPRFVAGIDINMGLEDSGRAAALILHRSDGLTVLYLSVATSRVSTRRLASEKHLSFLLFVPSFLLSSSRSNPICTIFTARKEDFLLRQWRVMCCYCRRD